MQSAESVKRCIEFWVSRTFNIECSVAFGLQEKSVNILLQERLVIDHQQFPALVVLSLSNSLLVDPAEMHDAMRDIYMHLARRGREHEDSL